MDDSDIVHPFARSAPRRRSRRWVLHAILGAVSAAPFVWMVATRPKDPPVAAASQPVRAEATPVTDLPAPETTSTEAADAFRLGAVAFRAGSVEEAIRQYELAVAADPDFAAAHLRLAFLDGGEPEGNLRHYHAAREQRAKLSPRDQALLDGIAPWLGDAPDSAEAVKRLEASLAGRRFDAELLWLLGKAYEDDARPDEALPMWARAAAVDPEFAMPLWSRARLVLERGSEAEANEALARCLEISPGASSCLDVRALIELHDGECAKMEADARAMSAGSPSEERGYADLARALAAEGAPVPAVEQALAEKWARTPAPRDAWRRVFDEVDLATWKGDLDEARRALDEADEAISSVPIESVHDEHARRAMLLFEETGEMARAADVARRFLARRRGWTGHAGTQESEVERDAVPLALSVLVRTGGMSGREREPLLGAWHDAWRARLGDSARRMLWFPEYGTTARTAADAQRALAALSESSPLPDWYTFASADADVGRVHFLAGELAAAVPLLRRGAAACNVLDHPIEHARVEALVGEALEQQGDTAGACVAYGTLLGWWSSARQSLTVKAAAARQRALDCPR